MKEKINRGQPLEELVKGSLDYTMQMIRDAFWKQFPDASGNYYIAEMFADHVIISGWGETWPLKADEYYRVAYEISGDGYSFAARADWEVVELAYQTQTPLPSASPQMRESTEFGGRKRRGVRLEERIEAMAILEEAQEGKPRRVRFEKAMTADVVNGNGRRYPASVLQAAVAELGGHLHESAGQGRAIQVLGEAEHPSEKGGRPNLLETVTKWENVTFDGQDVTISGRILETSKGKDILTLMEGGVMPGVSMRGYGEGKTIKEGSEKLFEVTDLHITGFDLVLEPSFENSAELIESQQTSKEDDMNIEEILKLLKEHPELFKGITEAQIKEMGEAQLTLLEGRIRQALGLDEKADIAESLKAMAEKARQFEEGQRQAEVEKAIAEATKDLPFGKKLNEAFVEALKEAKPTSAAQVKELAEAKRKEYGKFASANALAGMGFNGPNVQVKGPVIEAETGVPEFAGAAFAIQESILRRENKPRFDLRQAVTASQIMTLRLLERFDKLNRQHLVAEARLFEEAEQVSDLNLPYSVSRAIIEEAFPDLIAANVFEVGILENSPDRLYYEVFAGETGYSATVTDESITADLDTWVNLANRGRLTPGTVVVTTDPAGTTYTEGTDYVIDYAGGRFKALTGGAIADSAALLIDYGYTAVRKGEMAAIERGKLTLTYKTVEAAADRLADQISREAVVFSRSQLGLDATTRTLANLAKQLRRKVDQGLLYMAWSAVKSVASNSGGTWTAATDALSELLEKIGVAKVKVADRFYSPTFLLMSVTNADVLSNWDGFTRDGFPNAILNAAGFAGSVKGLPIFGSTEFPDSEIVVGNRQLVQHMVYQPMQFKGPFPSYDSNGKLIAADQYYAEEFNVTEALVPEKGAYVVIA